MKNSQFIIFSTEQDGTDRLSQVFSAGAPGVVIVTQPGNEREGLLCLRRRVKSCGAAEMLLRNTDEILPHYDQEQRQSLIVSARKVLGEEMYAAALYRGISLSLEDAIAQAMSVTGGRGLAG